MSSEMPSFERMMWLLLRALKEMGGSATNQELLEKVLDLMEFSEEIQNISHGDGPRTEVDYRLAWARTYLKKVDAIDDSVRGVWSISAEGRNLVEEDVKKFLRLSVSKKVPKKLVRMK